MACMRSFRCCVAPAAAIAMLGCSAHPLPETHLLNFPRASTYDIVHRVRCEAQEALVELKNRARRPKRKARVQDIITATSIGYDFEFVMIEDNAASAVLGFGKKSGIKGSKDSLSLSANAESSRKRSNTRAFRIVEELGDVEKADCKSTTQVSNLAYPISGRLNIKDVVQTYVRLQLMTNLGDLDDDDADIDFIAGAGPEKKRAGVFAEQLEFKTTLTAGANPTLQLSAIAGDLRLTSAGGTCQPHAATHTP